MRFVRSGEKYTGPRGRGPTTQQRACTLTSSSLVHSDSDVRQPPFSLVVFSVTLLHANGRSRVLQGQTRRPHVEQCSGRCDCRAPAHAWLPVCGCAHAHLHPHMCTTGRMSHTPTPAPVQLCGALMPAVTLRHPLRESLGLPSPRSVFESLDANGHGKLTKSMIEEAGISAGLHYDQIERLFKRCAPVWTWGRGGVWVWVLGVARVHMCIGCVGV